MYPGHLTTCADHRVGENATATRLAFVLGTPRSAEAFTERSTVPTADPISPQDGLKAPIPDTQSTTVNSEETSVASSASLSPVPSPIKLVVPPPLTISTERFNLLQLWEGVIEEVRDDAILVTLIDQTNRNYPEEEAEISIAEIPEGDRYLVQLGAVFYWSIGYKEGPGQPRERVSRIRLRRLPAWSKRDIESARANAQELTHVLGTD